MPDISQRFFDEAEGKWAKEKYQILEQFTIITP